MEKLRAEKSFILPILVGIGHFVWFYLLYSVFYNIMGGIYKFERESKFNIIKDL